MYVELFLASIATYVWWNSTNGTLVNQLSLSVMFICSVSTVMFNGNPLMRFDGYYILMDLLEIPNLRQKSTEVVKRAWMHYCLGVEQPENPFLPQRNQFWFGLFTIAAVIYRWMIVFSILYFLNSVFEPVGLKRLGQIIALAGFVGLVVQPLVQLYKFVYTPGRMRKVKRLNVSITIAVAVAAVASIFVLPLPHAVKCSFEVQPRGAKPVYASVPGAVDDHGVQVKPGDHVVPGQVIAQLVNLDLEQQYQTALGTVKEAEAELESLRQQRIVNDNIHLKLEQAQETLKTAREALAEKSAERDRLKLVAPAEGVIVPPPPRKDQASKADGRLAKWSASPFDEKNKNAWFATSDLICLVHDPAQGLEASLVIDQADVELIRLTDKVRILLDANTHRAFDTTIEDISTQSMVAVPQTMSSQGGGRIDTRSDQASGMQIPLSASYQAKAPLPADARIDWQVGVQGQARVYTGWKTIAWRLGRYLSRTFHFEL